MITSGILSDAYEWLFAFDCLSKIKILIVKEFLPSKKRISSIFKIISEFFIQLIGHCFSCIAFWTPKIISHKSMLSQDDYS